MPTELKIPNIGESITEVQIAEWLKAEGDTVKKGENVAVIDSEKATLELPSPGNGRLAKILRQAGETVKIGEVIAEIETVPTEGETGPTEGKPGDTPVGAGARTETKPKAKTEGPEKAGAEKNEKPVGEEEKDVPRQEADSTEPVEAKPPVQETRETKAINPEASPQPPARPEASAGRGEEVVPMTMLRRTAAKRLVEARQQMAMLTTFNEIDLSAVQALRHEHQEAFQKRYQVKLGLMSFFVKAAIDALKQFPQLNAEIRGNDAVYFNYFDIGVAIASERGLVVPVLRNAQSMSFAETEKAIGDFARRAENGRLKPDELDGGTFTITNGGIFGSLLSTPIINPPQTGILGMHAIQERPIAAQGQTTIRPMMYVALTYDHRIVDGREAVLFLNRIKAAIEKPARMLIEI